VVTRLASTVAEVLDNMVCSSYIYLFWMW